MATPNYSYEKRQRELAKKRKQEDKRRSKLEQPRSDSAPGEQQPAEPAAPEGSPAEGNSETPLG